MTPSVQLIATTPLLWDAKPELASITDQALAAIDWLHSVKGKLTQVTQTVEASPARTDETIALHKALDWIDECEGRMRGIIHTDQLQNGMAYDKETETYYDPKQPREEPV